MNKHLTSDDLFKSFEKAKEYIEREFKAGKLTRERANSMIKNARENYRKQNYNRQLDRID